VEIIRQSLLPPEEAVRIFTENPAKALGIYPRKGALREGCDADILVTDKEYHLKMLFCMGKTVVNRT
jgi:N-acetylglucosamine-6-phosphate deacetylase